MKNGEILVVDQKATSPMTAQAVKKQVNLIQEVMRDVMVENEHFGTIPGCGDKMVLFKAGAEKLVMTFRLCPEYKIERLDLEDGHREYIIVCTLRTAQGAMLAQGVGSCSTMEKKFRYRKKTTHTGVPVPKKYWDTKNRQILLDAIEATGDVSVGTEKVNGSWQIVVKELAENPDLAEVYNTVLKIGKKRSMVDAAVTATAASDIFTQDFDEEDIADAINNNTVVTKTPKSVKKKVQQTKKAVTKAEAPAKEEGAAYFYRIEYGMDGFEEAKEIIKSNGGRWDKKRGTWKTLEPIKGMEEFLFHQVTPSFESEVVELESDEEEEFYG